MLAVLPFFFLLDRSLPVNYRQCSRFDFPAKQGLDSFFFELSFLQITHHKSKLDLNKSDYSVPVFRSSCCLESFHIVGSPLFQRSRPSKLPGNSTENSGFPPFSPPLSLRSLILGILLKTQDFRHSPLHSLFVLSFSDLLAAGFPPVDFVADETCQGVGLNPSQVQQARGRKTSNLAFQVQAMLTWSSRWGPLPSINPGMDSES